MGKPMEDEDQFSYVEDRLADALGELSRGAEELNAPCHESLMKAQLSVLDALRGVMRLHSEAASRGEISRHPGIEGVEDLAA